MHGPAHDVLKECVFGCGICSRPVAHGEMAVKATDGKPLRDVICPRDIYERPLVSAEYESTTEASLLFVLPCDHVMIARDQVPQPVMWC